MMNQNQKIVFEWLKDHKNQFWLALTKVDEGHDEVPDKVWQAFYKLSHAEQFQLLAEFAKLGLGEV